MREGRTTRTAAARPAGAPTAARVLAATPGEHDLRVEADGYEIADVPGVSFVEGRATPVDVRLTPKAK